ncbi:hypothetical protein G8A07_14645 [Roseateles sp. DAIF2]|uniref:hypothetical protein n=1 Tax=Roseateles sp. DAIF2 TaxID=2714952 RepID=UPI0018A25C4F|nr:hypothetical protein [Roseateles sp. DAIF2]QPF74031.1 hypothetical protein G8A07_14645 [Roseateles sp. DAIF2]
MKPIESSLFLVKFASVLLSVILIFDPSYRVMPIKAAWAMLAVLFCIHALREMWRQRLFRKTPGEVYKMTLRSGYASNTFDFLVALLIAIAVMTI